MLLQALEIIIFQSLMDLRKSRCDILSGTTQGWACPIVDPSINLLVYISNTFEPVYNCSERRKMHLSMHVMES
jgi:hypothetical protein